MIRSEADILNDTTRIIEAIKEQIKSEAYDMMVTDHAEDLMGNLFGQKALVEWLINEDLTDEDYRFELESWTQNGLEDLASELHNSDEAAHEWADSDGRVIYTYKALAFYEDRMDEVEAEAEELCATGNISDQITAGVYGVIRNDYMEELNGLADDIESYDAEDFI